MVTCDLEGLSVNELDLAGIIKSMKNWSPVCVDQKLERAEKLIPLTPKTAKKLDKYIDNLCYDENFLSLAGLDYTNPDTKLIRAGIAYSLLLA
jgi:hypothetical protein